MRREVFLSLAAVAILLPATLAAPPTVDFPSEVKPVGTQVLVQPRTNAVSIEYIGLDGVDPVPPAILKDQKTFYLETRGLKPVAYRFLGVAASSTGEQIRFAFVVKLGDSPGPGPDPPPPPPPPDPNVVIPIGGEGFRVLMVVESSDRTKLPSSQVATLTAAEVINYLNSKCADGSQGWKEWRQWDPDVTKAPTWTTVPKHWRDAMARERKSLPWVLISNGKAGFEGPLPETPAKFLELLKKYGG